MNKTKFLVFSIFVLITTFFVAYKYEDMNRVKDCGVNLITGWDVGEHKSCVSISGFIVPNTQSVKLVYFGLVSYIYGSKIKFPTSDTVSIGEDVRLFYDNKYRCYFFGDKNADMTEIEKAYRLYIDN